MSNEKKSSDHIYKWDDLGVPFYDYNDVDRDILDKENNLLEGPRNFENLLKEISYHVANCPDFRHEIIIQKDSQRLQERILCHCGKEWLISRCMYVTANEGHPHTMSYFDFVNRIKLFSQPGIINAIRERSVKKKEDEIIEERKLGNNSMSYLNLPEGGLDV